MHISFNLRHFPFAWAFDRSASPLFGLGIGGGGRGGCGLSSADRNQFLDVFGEGRVADGEAFALVQDRVDRPLGDAVIEGFGIHSRLR